MGTYLNPGSARFETALRGEIYIDKTGLINYLNSVVSTPQKYISVSRPRRFGKTMTADMICAYYDRTADARKIFESKDIAHSIPAGKSDQSWDKFLNQFDVLRIVMTDFMRKTNSVSEMLDRMQKLVMRDIQKQFHEIDFYDANDLLQSMEDIYVSTGKQFVVVIDEWDAVFRMWAERHEEHTIYLNFLRDWLKDQEYIALAYMTGILPIKKYGVHSALNMFREFSMISPQYFARYTGFTDEEVQELCRKYGRPYDLIREWYDGYRVSDVLPPDPDYQEQKRTGSSLKPQKYALYSPVSVVESISSGEIRNYWNQTETFEALSDYINRNFDGLKEITTILMDGDRMPIDISTYQNDMTTFHSKDDILTLLIHLGYLGYDSETKEIFIPNKEVLGVFKSSTKSLDWAASFKALEASQRLLEATWNKDAETVAKLLELAHEQAGTDGYHSEAAFSYAIQLAYYNAKNYYSTFLELATGKGYADLVYLPAPEHPNKPALLIELKYNKNADAAIAQIHRQQYPQALEKYKGNLLLIGVNYNRSETHDSAVFKHHTCVIEEA